MGKRKQEALTLGSSVKRRRRARGSRKKGSGCRRAEALLLLAADRARRAEALLLLAA
jgi:hypothetical protein